MYKDFYGMTATPFARDIPVDSLYVSEEIANALGRLSYTADRQLFAVVTAEPGCGKSTLIRRFAASLPKDKYILIYLSDSKLTPRWFYAGMLDQLGLESKFYRGDSKRRLQQEIESLRNVHHKKVVCVVDEAHLLSRETLEEIRFLLNYRFDSMSPLALILVGQQELWEDKLRRREFTAIRQRIDMRCTLSPLDRAETERYIQANLKYAGCDQEIFTEKALDAVYKVSAGVPRMINRTCEKCLMYSAQQQRKLIDDYVVKLIGDHEILSGGDK